MYKIDDDGSIQYVGGSSSNGFMTVEINHPGRYAVLEYSKQFTDVRKTHWAFDAIQMLTAKHVISGISDLEFGPESKVSRGQFAAMLSRAFKLKANQTNVNFKDVSKEAYYYSAVAAIYQAGIARGRSEDHFAPDETISREEMAVMIIKVYELLTKSKVEAKNSNSFSDELEFSDWAKASIDTAVELKLMNGRNGNLFAPKDKVIRAESAKVIADLLMLY